MILLASLVETSEKLLESQIKFHFERSCMFFHKVTVEGKINPVTYIFISKNDYSMRDDKNIQISATQGSNINTQETADALRKQIENETTPNATLVEEE